MAGTGQQAQLSVEALITAPLVAASKANVVMTTGQVKALLENCFTRKRDGLYEPIMIRMSLTRGELREEAAPSDGEFIGPVTLTFSVPLLSIIPINNLVVDKVDVEFDLEITAVASRERKPLLQNLDRVVDDKAVLLGKVANKSAGAGGTAQAREAARLKVNINAGPLPLSPGLLAVLDLYSKSIQPIGMERAPRSSGRGASRVPA